MLIQGIYPYEPPPIPKDEKDIINFDIKDKSLQYWRTPILPNFKTLSAYNLEKFILQEDERIRNGVHFFNNGEVVYINGAHYEYLTYWKPDYQIDFRETDRQYFFFDEFVDNYKSTFGKVIFKPRVGGFTAKENFLSFRKVKMGFDKHVALINTTDINAKMLQYKPILSCYLQYPEFLRPKIRMVNGKLPESGMFFSPSTDTDKNKYLKGWLLPFPPKANSLDGKRLHYIFIDEYAKLESLDPETIIKPYLKTIFLPSENKIQGRMTFVSTLGTDDKLMQKAIEFSLKMWRESNFEEKDENGFTKSKFLRYFISAYDVAFIDKYGYADYERAYKHQEETLKKIIKNDGEFSKAHITELRENPRTINDLINSPKNNATFNISQAITVQRDKIQLIPKEERGYIGGKFVMTQNGNIVFDASEKDYGWKIKGINTARTNVCTKVGGEWKLPKVIEGVVGYDPVRFSNPTSNHYSIPAIVIYRSTDKYETNNKLENEFIGQYIGRKKNNNEVHEQAVLASLYFGFFLAPERNVGLDYFENNGYIKLIQKSIYDNGRGIMITTGRGDKNVLEHGIAEIYKWVIGKKSQFKTNVETLVFEELLEQLETFTPEVLNTHDLIAATIQCLLTAKHHLIESGINKSSNGKKSILNLFYQDFI